MSLEAYLYLELYLAQAAGNNAPERRPKRKTVARARRRPQAALAISNPFNSAQTIIVRFGRGAAANLRLKELILSTRPDRVVNILIARPEESQTPLGAAQQRLFV